MAANLSARIRNRGIRVTALIALLALPFEVLGAPIAYEFGWEATTTTTIHFADAQFSVSFTGDTTSVRSTQNSSLIHEGLTGEVGGPLNTSAVTAGDQVVGIQPPDSRAQSLIWADRRGASILDLSAAPISNYDLRSPLARVGLDGSFVSEPTLPGLDADVDFLSASGFTFESLLGTDDSITYRFGWNAAGSIAFTERGKFTATFEGDTRHVRSTQNSSLIHEDLTGRVEGPSGLSASTRGGQIVGIQPPGSPAQSLTWADRDGAILNLSAAPISDYDLQSSLDLVSLSGLSLRDPGLLGIGTTEIDFGSASDFTFEVSKAAAPVPEPGPLALMLSGVVALILLRFTLRGPAKSRSG